MESVDIYNNPGVTLNATVALRIAGQHQVEDVVLWLLPYTVFGSDYDRGIHEYLRDAIRLFNAGRVEEGQHWLDEAVRWAGRQGYSRG